MPHPASVLLLAVLLLGCQGERVSGPLPQEAYVWQRSWSPEVRQAVGRASDLDGLIVLAAEVDFSRRPPHVVRIPYDTDSLAGRRVGLAVRIGAFSRGGGRYRAEPGQIDLLAGLARGLVDGARGRGLSPSELQLDYDCPESRLREYPGLIRAVRAAVAPVPVVVTALPAWLRHEKAFTQVLQAADGYVLQVHSLRPPADPREPVMLLDPEASRDWVEAAARFRRPFRVALPTYGYTVAFDSRGTLLGLAAEGPGLAWPVGTVLREARSDPAVVATLVGAWTRERPRELTGLVWYRLPVPGDRRNWPWTAFQAVRAGQAPHRALRIDRRSPEPGLVEIELRGAGEAEVRGPGRLRVRWIGDAFLAGDGVGGYRARRTGQREVVLERGADSAPLRPGDRRTVAWLRFAVPTEIEIEPTASP